MIYHDNKPIKSLVDRNTSSSPSSYNQEKQGNSICKRCIDITKEIIATIKLKLETQSNILYWYKFTLSLRNSKHRQGLKIWRKTIIFKEPKAQTKSLHSRWDKPEFCQKEVNCQHIDQSGRICSPSASASVSILGFGA